MIPNDLTGLNGDRRPTPTEYAKRLMLQAVESTYYWTEQIGEEDLDAVTEREKDLIKKALVKQHARITKLMNLKDDLR